MKADFYHEINNDPEPEDADTIRIIARVFGESDTLTFSTVSLANDFIDDEIDECKSKEDLNYFFMEAGVDDDVISDALLNLIDYVDDVTCSASSEYSPGCALEVRLDLGNDDDDDDDDDFESQIEEAVHVSFDESSNIPSRPASKLAVKSLRRKIFKKKTLYKKISLEECTICLEEFNNGGRVVTLPCGHYFDDNCIAKWLETSHVCPLCRFVLPCEDL